MPNKKKQVKYNEIVGIPAFVLMLIFMFANILNPSITKFILLVIFGFTANIFLSWWGLTTFNNKFNVK